MPIEVTIKAQTETVLSDGPPESGTWTRDRKQRIVFVDAAGLEHVPDSQLQAAMRAQAGGGLRAAVEKVVARFFPYPIPAFPAWAWCGACSRHVKVKGHASDCWVAELARALVATPQGGKGE